MMKILCILFWKFLFSDFVVKCPEKVQDTWNIVFLDDIDVPSSVCGHIGSCERNERRNVLTRIFKLEATQWNDCDCSIWSRYQLRVDHRHVYLMCDCTTTATLIFMCKVSRSHIINLSTAAAWVLIVKWENSFFLRTLDLIDLRL